MIRGLGGDFMMKIGSVQFCPEFGDKHITKRNDLFEDRRPELYGNVV